MNQNELATRPITPLFAKYSFLTFIGMLAQGIMVVLEGFIIGNGLGANGLTVVGLIMPVEYLNLALGGCFAIGISTLTATRRGNGKEEEARKAYADGLWFTLFFMVILSVLIAIFAGPVATLLGAPAEYHDEVKTFIRIFMCWYPFCTLGQVAVYMARVDEKPSIGTWAMTGSAIAAIIYLYLNTYVFHFGIVGAANYYGASIGLWAIACLYFVFSKKTALKAHLSDLKNFDWSNVLTILKIGFPYLLVQACSTVFSIVVNNILGTYGTATDIAAFAVINGYIVYLLMMIVQSTTGGMQPIASYNMGAKLYDRVEKLLRVSMVGTIVVVEIGAILFTVFATPICTLFIGTGDPELLSVSVQYTKIMIICASLGYCSNLMSGYFQSVEKILISTILGVCRYIFFGIPIMLILSNSMGTMGVWYAQPIADIGAFVLTIIFVIRESKRLKKIA